MPSIGSNQETESAADALVFTENGGMESGLSEQRQSEADGAIETSGGALRVLDPQEDGTPALLIPNPPLRLWVNGSELLEPLHVSAGDRIEWEMPERPLFAVDAAPGGMQAHIRVYADTQYAWKLEDSAPAASCVPRAVPDLKKPLKKLGIAEIMAEIGTMGICKNLDVPAVVQALQDADGQPVPFASGLEAVQGEDARLELFFGEKIENAFEEVAGALDYRNHLRIPSVQPGDPLARLIPSASGEPGYDVYGKVLSPDPVREIELHARQHVEAGPDGLFTALKAGRPCITSGAVRYLDISDAYVVAGDVDLKTGHIVFSGDVAIQGSVTDNMIVESLGNVYVSGGVYHATITAAGSITVLGSTIGSRLYSGSFGLAFNRLFHLSQQLREEIGQLLSAARMLYAEVCKRGQSARFGQVALLLLKTKFKEIQPRIRELLQVMVTVQRSTGSSSNEFADDLNLMLSPALMIEALDEQVLSRLEQSLEKEHSFVSDMQQGDSRIELSRCQTSTIKSNGDILIHREGVLQSDLYSGGSIAFANPVSVCRGSCLEAEDRIDARTVGSAGGAPCVLKAKHSIQVQRMYEGRIAVDGLNRDIFAPVENRTFGRQDMDLESAFS
ncbi:FapA family protein [Saccharibacillus sp. CPCC 101409]|uniref:FapA family protein n=1 Tax=Saccharibacillus sp. CPCC 101409 TaxID=3058041 RepID=UPI002673D0D6|nr:FapA family protein [Saccharibacillus sp. CPCC 101409]MDO3410456.1 FapA family protein [Saccharibacillus sp. CPCC 101409]